MELFKIFYCGEYSLKTLKAFILHNVHKFIYIGVLLQESIHVLGTVVTGLVTYVHASCQIVDDAAIVLAANISVVYKQCGESLLILVSLAQDLYTEDLPDFVATNLVLSSPTFAFHCYLAFCPEYNVCACTVVVATVSHVVLVPCEATQGVVAGEIEVVLARQATDVLVVGDGSRTGSFCYPLAITELNVVGTLLALYGNEAYQILKVAVRANAFLCRQLVNY